MFSIITIANKGMVQGKLVDVTKFLVVDASGEPVVSKFFDSEADAQAVIDGMGNLSEGLAFASAKFPGLAPKAQKGKANTIAEYLDWIAAGRPVTELTPEVAESAEAGEVVSEGQAGAGAAALDAGEDF